MTAGIVKFQAIVRSRLLRNSRDASLLDFVYCSVGDLIIADAHATRNRFIKYCISNYRGRESVSDQTIMHNRTILNIGLSMAHIQIR
jgi:hypothetical protein